jgi:hypothetical protein
MKIIEELLKLASLLANKLQTVYENNTKLKSLLERLAPERGVIDYEFSKCYYCDADMRGDSTEHKPDCPWLEALKLLEELK